MCDQDINECASNPCLNLGKCVDLVNQYGCVCNTTYYTGRRCERPVLQCFEPEGVDRCNSNGDCEGGIGYEPVVCKCNYFKINLCNFFVKVFVLF
jgi:protein crumbs